MDRLASNVPCSELRSPAAGALARPDATDGEQLEGLMRALIAGGGMAGLMTALALRESGVFTTIDVFEQTHTPSTAGAGLNIPPNAARLSRWLGVDLDGGDPKGPDGAVDGGRAAILSETRMVWEDGSITRKPLDHNTSANDSAGFHHMHRLDLLMCLHKRVSSSRRRQASTARSKSTWPSAWRASARTRSP